MAGEHRWQGFLEELDIWFSDKKFGNKAETKKWFRNVRTLIRRIKYFPALRSLYLSFRKGQFFWAYKNIGIKVPQDIDKFIV